MRLDGLGDGRGDALSGNVRLPLTRLARDPIALRLLADCLRQPRVASLARPLFKRIDVLPGEVVQVVLIHIPPTQSQPAAIRRRSQASPSPSHSRVKRNVRYPTLTKSPDVATKEMKSLGFALPEEHLTTCQASWTAASSFSLSPGA